jgi:hypothetical protein
MEQNDRFGLWVRGVEPVVNIAVGVEGADDAGTGRRGDGVALGTDGNLAIVADPHVGAPAPDEGPPGTGRSWAEQAAVVSEGLGFSSVRRGAEVRGGFRVRWRGAPVGRTGGWPRRAGVCFRRRSWAGQRFCQ